MNNLTIAYIVILAISFLLGSIPFGLLVSRGIYKTDVRGQGSGNIGAANVMRVVGTKGGVITLVLDLGKGMLAGLATVIACNIIWPGEPAVPLWGPIHTGDGFIDANALRAVAGVGTVLGHVFCPWLNFRGGKGIAVALGCAFFVFGPLGAVFELVIFVLVVMITRYVSLGSLAAAISCPFLALWLLNGSWLAFVLCALFAAVIIWAHRANIDRLRNHCENRFGSGRQQMLDDLEELEEPQKAEKTEGIKDSESSSESAQEG